MMFFTVASSSSLNNPLYLEWELSVEAYTFTKWTGAMVVFRLRARILFLTVRPNPYSSGGFPPRNPFFVLSLMTEDGSKFHVVHDCSFADIANLLDIIC